MSDDWMPMTLGEVATWGAGGTPKAGDPRYYEGGEIPWAVIADVQDGPLYETEKSITQEGADIIGHLAPKGSVLVTMYGTIGRVAITEREMATNQAIAWGIPDESLVSLDFLFHWLRNFQPTLDSLARGATQRNINRAILKESPITLPPLPVQRRIVDLMAHLDNVIVDLQNEFDSNMHLSDAIRNELFEDSGRTVPLVEVFEVTNGRQRSPKHASGKDMIQYVRAANVKDGHLELDNPHFMNFDPKEQLKYRLIAGDVLITEGCGSLSQIGASCRWMGEVNDIVCFQNHLLRLRPKSLEVDSELAYQWARHSFRSGRFAEIATGTSIFSLGTKRVERMPLPVACLDSPSLLQAASQSDALADKTFDELAAVRSFRNALLRELSSGQTMIPNTYEQLLRLDA